MKILCLSVILSFLTAFLAVAQVASLQAGKPGDKITLELRTNPGDVFQSREDYIISENGMLKLHGLPHEIPVDGVPFNQLVLQINEAFVKSGIQPVPAAKGINFASESCFLPPVMAICGEVQKPGEYPLRQGMPLTAAITKAGGFATNADISKVKLIRAKQETVYDLRVLNPDGFNNPVLMDGDEIVIPKLQAEIQLFRRLLKPGDPVLLNNLIKNGAGYFESITTTYKVSERGFIKLPRLEEMEASGLTVEVLIQRINAAYQTWGIAGVTVSAPKPAKPEEPKDWFKLRKGPGKFEEFPLRAGMTLLAAINRAGGMDGKVRKIKILRAGKELIFDVGKIHSDGSNNPVLMDGDEIVVP